MVKVGIVGYGYVGKAMHAFFSKKYQTVFYDPFVTGSCTKEEINACDLAVVCVFTPQDPVTQACDTSIVEEVVNWIQAPVILIKSTVAPGTTEMLKKKTGKRIVFSPEYIGESTYDTGKHDFNREISKHDFMTFGGDIADITACIDLVMPIFGPNKTYHSTDSTTAEIAKYMENCYFATKLVFCYEFDQICKAFQVPYHGVRECWLLDPRIESSHTAVFATNTAPFDGKCLPKDLAAIIEASKQSGFFPQFLQSVQQQNLRLADLRKD